MGEAVTTVLGNHDLHLLAAAAGHARRNTGDTFEDILRSSDCGELITWLRQRPLLHWDAPNGRALVHAGIPPQWTLATALEQAAEVESILRGPDWKELFEYMYGDEPAVWSAKLNAESRRRYTINALTRMRFLLPDGALELSNSGPPAASPPDLTPWFRFPGRGGRDTKIIFGHWAALGFQQENNIAAIDSGCVWGGCLSALPLDPPGEVISIACKL